MLSELGATVAVVRQVGRGTFISGSQTYVELSPRRYANGGKSPSPLSPERLARTNPTEVFETRLIVEPKAALLAAQRAAPEDMREMGVAISRGCVAQSLAEFENWDAAFHSLVVRSARNELL